MYEAYLSRDFNPSWKALKDNASIKASVIHRLCVMHGYGSSYEQFVADFNGRGRVIVTESYVQIQFSSLNALGIDADSVASPADLDRQFREKLTELADPKSHADKIVALNKIIGTVLNNISTTPIHSLHHRS